MSIDFSHFKKKLKPSRPKNPVTEIVNYYYALKGLDLMPKEFWVKNRNNPEFSYARNMSDAKKVLEFYNNDLSYIMTTLYKESKRAKEKKYPWRITTILKNHEQHSTEASETTQ